MTVEKITGDKRHADLANTVADALTASMEAGLDPGEAISVTLNVAADYWREMQLGPLSILAEIVQRTPERPSPVITNDMH